ncbi:8-amino-7-oxononanoate synthase [candidate division WOR-1 bacterium RIFCSPHIGHO2_01_FULL_53_15]|uniref:8-amino-7-ketopelargonate synthase n=1 Tax=candidate division WOR-1 bacterium RIFCSPHIGHO2_01_FULL_53_15 TaxID=1802564 RepID=A0A1F4Q2T7_UNCSA|nr:MAG: 8-amino-7-oxononanoate synthase [candidate division WOR-1 bacterium RIFCSPHIGHO2_01_FULL_53_15]OGC13018.1 MAG: 8-amino-7-oxononanoate synthase [candidate division WOR-1 bacterium RIFCSPHIGHO2_02_FULL_53_26]
MENELAELKVAGLYRTLKTIEKTDGRFVWINGQRLINFCSNNYLGLANHPKVIETAKSACEEFGAGAGASRLVSGNLILHEKLEAKLAAFKGREAALVFPTGFMANLGIISSLTDENDTIIIDRLNHASIIDACRLSKAKLQVYPHKDMVALEKILKRSGKFKKRLIVTDSVFSLDGDLAPLPQIVELAKKYDSLTMIDEAHATGVLGVRGLGLEEHYGLPGKVDIIMGTLSKALGSLGGFVAGSQTLIDYIKNKARSFIYTTALPPSACAAAIASLEIIEDEPEHLRRLRENIKTLTPACRQAGARRSTIPPLPEGEGKTPIMPIIIGPAEKTLEISEKLFERGIFLSAIRPPTVPKGASRLRLTINSLHTKEDLKCLASSLQALIPA